MSMYSWTKQPTKRFSWGLHGFHLGPVGPRWAPCWPHDNCYQRNDVKESTTFLYLCYDICCFSMSCYLFRWVSPIIIGCGIGVEVRFTLLFTSQPFQLEGYCHTTSGGWACMQTGSWSRNCGMDISETSGLIFFLFKVLWNCLDL